MRQLHRKREWHMLCQRSLHKPLQKPFKESLIKQGRSDLPFQNLKGKIQKKYKPHPLGG